MTSGADFFERFTYEEERAAIARLNSDEGREILNRVRQGLQTGSAPVEAFDNAFAKLGVLTLALEILPEPGDGHDGQT